MARGSEHHDKLSWQTLQTGGHRHDLVANPRGLTPEKNAELVLAGARVPEGLRWAGPATPAVGVARLGAFEVQISPDLARSRPPSAPPC